MNRACTHVMSTGKTCGAYALRESELCYWHHKARQTHGERRPTEASTGIVLPLFEDANSIQLAIQKIAQAVADRRLSRAEAGMLLYSIQLAMTNLKNVTPAPPIYSRLVEVLPKTTDLNEDLVEPTEIPEEHDPAHEDKREIRKLQQKVGELEKRNERLEELAGDLADEEDEELEKEELQEQLDETAEWLEDNQAKLKKYGLLDRFRLGPAKSESGD